jgi:hypothetical protein
VSEKSYLIRYGVMSHVGRFSALPACETLFERGQYVVIQTDRGVELGEVLVAVEGKPAPPENGLGETAAQANAQDLSPSVRSDSPRVLRVAGPDDLSCSRRAEEARPSRFSLCQRVLREGNWPWELIDVEPLLDDRSTVLHYLGPHHIDVASLRARFRVECDMDIVLEPVGPDLLSDDDDAHLHKMSAGCANCGCGASGGCGSTAATGPADHDHHEDSGGGCAPSSHSGCSSCGINRLLAERSRARA